MSWLLHWEEELGKLDELLALLANAPPSPEAEIAQEHIQSARTCVLGAMSAECELNLARSPTSNRQGAGDRAASIAYNLSTNTVDRQPSLTSTSPLAFSLRTRENIPL